MGPGVILRRPHLVATLNGDGRAIMLRAEGGAGKTMLVTDWLHSTNDSIPTVWITLDQNFRSPRAFWSRFAEALLGRNVIEAHGSLGRIATGEGLIDNAASLITDELAMNRAGLRLIVDDLHLLDDDGQAELAQLIARVPTMRFIGMSRSGTLLDSGPLASRLNTTILGSEQLTLSREELTQLAEGEPHEFSPSELAAIYEVTGGHVLTTRLSLTVTAQVGKSDTNIDLRSLLVSRIAEAIDIGTLFPGDGEVGIAYRSAIAPYVREDLATDLTGNPDAWRLIESFESKSLGTRSADNGYEIFTFHKAIHAALNAHAIRVMSPQELRTAYRIAAAHMTEWGDPVEAIRLLIGAGDYDEVWPVYVRHFSVLSIPRRDDLLPVLESIPDDVLARHGTLALALAVLISEHSGRPSPRVQKLVTWGLRWLNEQEEPPTDHTMERILYFTSYLAAYRTARQYPKATQQCNKIAEAINTLWNENPELARTTTFPLVIQMLITYILNGQFSSAIAVAEDNSDLLDQHLPRRNHRTAIVAYAHALRGEMPAARAPIESFPPADILPAWRQSLSAIGWNIATALSRLEAGDIPGAHEAMDPLEYRASFSEHWAIIFYVQGLTRLVNGDAAIGHAELAQALERSEGRIASPATWGRLSGVFADLSIATGDLAAAERILDAAPTSPLTELARARLTLMRGENDSALELTNSAARSGLAPRELVIAWLISAVAGRKLGLSDGVDSAVANAVTYLRRYGLTSPLAFIARGQIDDLLEAHGFPIPEHIGNPFGVAQGEALSSRERVVLRLLQTSATTSDIAQQLFVSTNTIKSQVRSIYRKLGVSRRAEAIEMAQKRGLV